MLILKGRTASRGIACGPAAVIKKRVEAVKSKVADGQRELERLNGAIEEAKRSLEKLYDKAVREVGEDSAAIFEVHRMILEDEDFLDAVRNLVGKECYNAAYAAYITGENFAGMFAEMDDDYMKARATDMRDVAARLVRILSGEVEPDLSDMVPSVIVADDLTPSETVQMDKSKILAFITVHGSPNSHTSILARMLGIPALIGVPVDIEKLQNGTNIVVDAIEGEAVIDPDDKSLKLARQRIEEEERKQALLQSLRGKDNVTQDGRKIEIFANISSVKDVALALENDAGGIGLFRSEFLYLGKSDYPSEEEQYEAYKQVLQIMGAKKVVIRTLDIGADKQVDYFDLGKEANPAMGLRAIRICLTRPQIFKTQLGALFRAARCGNLSVMYPMITSVEEVQKIYKIVDEVKAELDSEGIPYKVPEQGIMVETPAAVMISDRLAEVVDFFSIGTNDLTQYTLAIDRQNEHLDEFYNPRHEAILRMIELTVKNAHAAGRWVGICGELGADPALTRTFIKMGVDELSVSPSAILPLRKNVRELKIDE